MRWFGRSSIHSITRSRRIRRTSFASYFRCPICRRSIANWQICIWFGQLNVPASTDIHWSMVEDVGEQFRLFERIQKFATSDEHVNSKWFSRRHLSVEEKFGQDELDERIVGQSFDVEIFSAWKEDEFLSSRAVHRSSVDSPRWEISLREEIDDLDRRSCSLKRRTNSFVCQSDSPFNRIGPIDPLGLRTNRSFPRGTISFVSMKSTSSPIDRSRHVSSQCQERTTIIVLDRLTNAYGSITSSFSTNETIVDNNSREIEYE